ncbi:MAG: YIP1 family protein, partial [Candidatus Hydrothermarchaeales archaeon]
MKCKECGAHLPYGAYGQIKCEFCNTPNYIPVPNEKSGVVEQAVENKQSFNLDEMGFVDTWKEVVQNPSDFFEAMPKTGGYTEPLKFAVICFLPIAIFMGLIIPLIGFFLSLIFAVIGIFVGAIFLHIGVLIFANENHENYEATVRLISYQQAPTIISWIPIVNIFASFYQFYLGVVGVMKVHKTSGIKAILAYIGIVLFFGFVIVGLIILFALYSR